MTSRTGTGRAAVPFGRLLGVLALALVLLAGAAPVEAHEAGRARPAAAVQAAAEPGAEAADVVLYWGDGCPRCEAERAWLAEVVARHPDLNVVQYEVWFDEANRDRFVAAGQELGFTASAVPTTVIGERVWVGWTDQIARDLDEAVDTVAAGGSVGAGVHGAPGEGTCPPEELSCTAGADEGADEGVTVDVPLVGEVSLGGQSLLVSTVVIGFVDGINPCSLWVISVLLTIVVRTASRRRVVLIGTTFLLVTTAMYALYMAGIYSALTVVGYLGAIRWVVAVTAGVFGAVSIKDYFAFKKGLSFTIKDSTKPGIYRRVRLAAGQRALLPALAATVALGVAVSLLETPCTAGFPVLWTGLLQANQVGPAGSTALFGAYMVPFLLDEMLVFGVAVVTMRASKMQEKHGRLLKLVAGVTMLALAGTMVLDPALMESPATALGVFAGAFVAAGLIHRVTELRRPARGVGAPSGTVDPPDAAEQAGDRGITRTGDRARP